MGINNTDVHTEHCCLLHGCKYNDPNCPVSNGWKKQSFPCESCPNKRETAIEHALRSFVSEFETDFVLNGEIVDNPSWVWTPLIKLYNQAKAALNKQ